MPGNKHGTSAHARTHTNTTQNTPRHLTNRTGWWTLSLSSESQPYLQQFDALCECSSVEAGFAACGIDVALDSIMWLAAGFIEGAQIHPGGSMAVVELNSTDVGLKCVHRLVLLLVEHPEARDTEGRWLSCNLSEFQSLSFWASQLSESQRTYPTLQTSIYRSFLLLLCYYPLPCPLYLKGAFAEPLLPTLEQMNCYIPAIPSLTDYRLLTDGSIPMLVTITMPLSISI